MRRLIFAFAALIACGLASCAEAGAYKLHFHASRAAPVLPVTFATITPGSTALGSWAATAQPATQGTVGDFGYAESAIAAWDLPDFLDYPTTQTFCVYANHLAGISHVDFAVNGGAFVAGTFTASSPNAGEPATCVNINPASFPTDQSFELRAIAYPNSGVPLILQGPGRNTQTSVASLYGSATSRGTMFHQTLSVYPGGTDSPTCGTSGGATGACLTMSQAGQNLVTAGGGDMGGGTICLGPNSAAYYYADTNSAFPAANRYVNIQPCAGVAKAQVTFTSADMGHGTRMAKTHVAHVNMVSTVGSPVTVAAPLSVVFLDDVTFVGAGKGHGDNIAGNIPTVFGRDLDISQTGDGFGNCALAVRVRIHDFDSDSFSNCYAVFEPAGDPTYVYHVEPWYTPIGAATFATADVHAGSTTIDNVSDTSTITVGVNVYDGSSPTACFPGNTVTAVFAHSITVTPAPTCTESGISLGSGSHPDIDQDVEDNFNITMTAGSTAFSTASFPGPFVGSLVGDFADINMFTPYTRIATYNPATGNGTLSKPAINTKTNYRVFTARNNVVLYGLTATNWINSQGIFFTNVSNFVADHVTINNVTAATIAVPNQQENDLHSNTYMENAMFVNSIFGGNNFDSYLGLNVLFKNVTCPVGRGGGSTGVTYVNSATCQ